MSRRYSAWGIDSTYRFKWMAALAAGFKAGIKAYRNRMNRMNAIDTWNADCFGVAAGKYKCATRIDQVEMVARLYEKIISEAIKLLEEHNHKDALFILNTFTETRKGGMKK